MGEAGDPALAERLDRMLARSPYRGKPKRHIEGGIAIGAQTRGWDASLATVGNWTVAMHGVIGNWPELAPAHGWDFPTDASSATKLAIAYEHLGDVLFGKLRGEYAILIHDRRENCVVAVRDLWGRRPLFFERRGSTSFIASEIRQILAGSRSTVEIDGDVLIQALLWRPTFPTRTHVRGIGRVQAGQVNIFRRNQTCDPEARQEIWEPPEETSGRYNIDELTEELRFLIDQAVKRWFVGVPFAVSLSGGVDSSTLWWAISRMAEAGDRNAALGRPFSWILPGHPFDESAQIKRILSATGTTGTLINCSSHDGIESLLQNAERMDSPFYGAITSAARFINSIQRDGWELMITGFGGDNVLGGSSAYFFDLMRNFQFFQALHDLFTHVIGTNQNRLGFIAQKTLVPAWRRLALWNRPRRAPEQPQWIHSSRHPMLESEPSPLSPGVRNRRANRHWNQVLSTIRMQQCLTAQEGAEQLQASVGVELGSPLIDLDLVDFAMGLPPRAFSDGKRYKQLLRTVAYDGLGEKIRSWANPSPWFHLTPEETTSLERLLPPHSWTLVSEDIVDVQALERLFCKSTTEPRVSSELGTLVVAETVSRRLICPRADFMRK